MDEMNMTKVANGKARTRGAFGGAFKKALHFLAAVVASLLYGPSILDLMTLMFAGVQVAFGIEPTSMRFYAENDWLALANLLLVIIGAFIIHRCHRAFPWRAVFGWGFCLAAVSHAVFCAAVLVGWHVNVDAVNLFLLEGEEAADAGALTSALHAAFYATFWLLIQGTAGLFLLRMKRVFLLAAGVVLSMAVSTAAWAKAENVTMHCFVHGHWEGSPVYDKMLDVLERSDSDEFAIAGAIFYVSNFYLSGPWMQGEKCYAADDQTRHALLKKFIFHFQEFPEFSVSLSDLIIERAAQGDVPALLLLTRMHATGFGVAENQEKAESLWGEIDSPSSEDWIQREHASIFH